MKMRTAIANLGVGKSVEFPIVNLCTVKTTASNLGAILDCRFKTAVDRKKRTVKVTRLK